MSVTGPRSIRSQVRQYAKPGHFWWFVWKGSEHVGNVPASHEPGALKRAGKIYGDGVTRVEWINTAGQWDGSKCVATKLAPYILPRSRAK